MWSHGGFTISTDPAHLDVPLIHRFLRDESYWAAGVPRKIVDQAIVGSLNVGLFSGDPARGDATQIGYARVVTDRATFAWLCDVFVLPTHRGKGLATWLIGSLSRVADSCASTRRTEREARRSASDDRHLDSTYGLRPVSRTG